MSANQLLSATAIGLKTVRVLFGNGGTPAYSADLTATSGFYTVALIGGLPAFVPVVQSVEGFETDGIGYHGVTLTFDQEFTPDSTYRVTVDSVTGIPFNGIDNVSNFAALSFGFPEDRSFELWDHVPDIDKAEDTAQELENFIACAQEVLDLLTNDVDRWIDILDSDVAPENFVDLMLADLGNPFVFTDSITLLEKRRLANALVAIYKLKGTTLGVQTAIQFFMGMKSEILRLDGLGNKLSAFVAYSLGFSSKLSAQTAYALEATPTFKLGSRRLWRFLLKAGTTVKSQTAAEAGSPVAGGLLTDTQKDQIKRILEIMKPAYMILVESGTEKQTGTEPSRRNGVRRNSDYSIDLIMNQIADVSDFIFWESGDNQAFVTDPVNGSPGVNEFNTTTTKGITSMPGDLAIAEDVVPKLHVRFNYDASSFSVSDPGAGNLRFGIFDPASATEIVFSETDAFFSSWYAGYVNQIDTSIGTRTVYARVSLVLDASKWAVYEFTADTTGGGWRYLTAVFKDGTLTGADPLSSPQVHLDLWADVVMFWNGVGQDLADSTNGLLGNEITNQAEKPSVTATAGTRKITLSWASDPLVTAWRIYRSTSAAGVTTDADNAATPIEISGDLTSYDDPQESGTTRYYIVSPVIGDSEGFMSDEVNATSL